MAWAESELELVGNTAKGAGSLPDGPAYFTSRGSLLGQVHGEVVSAARPSGAPKSPGPGTPPPVMCPVRLSGRATPGRRREWVVRRGRQGTRREDQGAWRAG